MIKKIYGSESQMVIINLAEGRPLGLLKFLLSPGVMIRKMLMAHPRDKNNFFLVKRKIKRAVKSEKGEK